MLRLRVIERIGGRVIIDSVGNEELVNAIAERFSGVRYRVTITYP